MVDFKMELPRLENGEPDLDIWLDHACRRVPASRAAAVRVFAQIEAGEEREKGLQLVELLLQLKMDAVPVMAGMSYFALQAGAISNDSLPDEVAHLVAAVQRLDSVSVLAFSDVAVLSSESKTQADNVRHMLISLIDDPRVAVIKLAERVVALRYIKDGDRAARLTMAREALAFFAPLASRLGIWQLKWSLEDLAFRYLYPKEFRHIAAKLDGRREVRERQVEAIRQDLEFRLAAGGIDAKVQGRAKHIFSIWNKMSHKAIDFSEVRDVQAVRVLVDRIDACYRVLGVVHTSWPHIPNEFDDYIANPKENGYRSIHTAVIGPAGKTLEVQIRTHEMHEEAELGLCAHWAYKDEADGKPDTPQSQKMDWLRSVLEWHEEQRRFAGTASAPNNFAADSSASAFAGHDRIYVTTPQGHVLDLASDATPVDFAYRIHTEIGHRCQGARVDGQSVSLNRRLTTGECVEIETGETAQPRREWLNPALGYVNTPRARSKIQSWFRGELAESNIQAGRALLEDTLARLQMAETRRTDADSDFQTLARMAGYRTEDDMLLAVGVGDQLVVDLIELLLEPNVLDPNVLDPGESPASPQGADQSTGELATVTVRGRDRDGLLRDVMAAVAAASVQTIAANARAEVPSESATISLQLHVADTAELRLVMEEIRNVADVVAVGHEVD